MGATSKKGLKTEIQEIIDNQKTDKEVEVLYQKMGETWFSFCVVDEEVFMAPVPEEVVLAKKQRLT